jgi:hypothetical protein
MSEPRVAAEEPDRSATPSRPAAITPGRVTCRVAGDFVAGTGMTANRSLAQSSGRMAPVFPGDETDAVENDRF